MVLGKTYIVARMVCPTIRKGRTGARDTNNEHLGTDTAPQGHSDKQAPRLTHNTEQDTNCSQYEQTQFDKDTNKVNPPTHTFSPGPMPRSTSAPPWPPVTSWSCIAWGGNQVDSQSRDGPPSDDNHGTSTARQSRRERQNY